ncbi:unnamed protein product [Psylliodes chrysocephalus]|uniref:Tesmin/TSO1-like CXC domain-containing protein n=1 Tax=Psylliodes chrysocephalus TaxID=3402493 RepID=A0A9P0CRJ1_9CUCU|nr:unnamed protein product [Psylliodes chrysocephala]
MLKNTKSDLYSLFVKTPTNIYDPEKAFFVLHGGLLIHKVKWTNGQKFSAMMDNYKNYILKHFGKRVIVIFDGYQTVSTKVDAIQQHLKRVYFQVQQWLHGDQLTMDPTKWGWRKEGDTLVPVQMEEKPAPKNIMELILCGCKGDCKLNNCSCRKHGLSCNLACKICEGSTCLNIERYSDENVNVPETEASDERDVPRMKTSVDDEENDQTHLSY